VLYAAICAVDAGVSGQEAIRVTAGTDASGVGLAVVGETRVTEGFAFRGDLERFVAGGADMDATVLSRSAPFSCVTSPDEPLRIATRRLAVFDGPAVPVIDPGEPSQVVGFLTREAPFDALVPWNELERKR
jgi:hypothetical protein